MLSQGNAAALRVSLLGPFAAMGPDGAITLSSHKAQALLAYLCRRPALSAPRETLVGLLWADSPENQARASLRQTLSTLKKALQATGYAGLNADGSSVVLDAGDLQVDANGFAAQQGDAPIAAMKAAIDAQRGEFLEGFGPVSPEFDRWLDAERAQFRARLSEILMRLCDASEVAGDLDGAISAAQRLLQTDPLQEQVHRRLMRLYVRQKRHDTALRQFDTLRAILSQDLDIGPDAETLALVAEIRRLRQARNSDGAGKTEIGAKVQSAARPSIAVMPFRGLPEGGEATLFAEGIAEEIIIELAREAGLVVVARASSFVLDPADTSHADIAEQLGVGFLLTGSVRTAAGKVRVTVQLVNSASGQAAWAERYDRDLRDVFVIQTEIARTVTATVIGRIASVEAEAANARPFESLEAAALVAQGHRHFLIFTREGLQSASDCFRRAVKLDPNYARAWGLEALAQIHLRWTYDLQSHVEEFLPIAERAVLLDNRDAKGHCALGVGNLVLRRFDKARHHFELGLRANPNDDLLLIEYGRFLIYVDSPELGLDRVREAMRLNPFHPNYYWHLEGRCLHMLGRHAEALEAFARMESPPFWIYVYLELCHRELGDETAAQKARAAYLHHSPSFDLDHFKSIFPYRNPETAARFFAGLG